MAKLVIVTGGSRGLGRALVDSAPDGSTRIDVSRRGHGGNGVRHLSADLADPSSWSEVGDQLAGEIGRRAWQRITLIHNAGVIEPIGFAGETDAEAVTKNVLLNSAAGQVLGHRFLALVRSLEVRRELLFISSGAARTSLLGWASYGAGKAAMDAWVRTVGREQAERGGAHVLSVAPGILATAMQQTIRESDEHQFPEVPRFQGLHERGELADPDVTAQRLWSLLDDRGVRTGSVLDLREWRAGEMPVEA